MWPNCCVPAALPDLTYAHALERCHSWPVEHVASGVSGPESTLAVLGDESTVFRLASVSKPIAAWAVLVALEEGSVSLDDPVGPPGATLRHCLSHASGLPFEGRVPIAGVGTRRIYSNTGIECACDHVAARTGMPFADYLFEAVLSPLGLEHTELRGSPAHGLVGSLRDILAFGREILAPTLVSQRTADEACSVQFPDLAGIVPGIGSYDPNPWGLGIEIRGAKHPHWMGTRTSARTVGHFGGAGTMFWVDPEVHLCLVALTDTPFDEWADTARAEWSTLSDAVIEESSRQ